MGSMKSSDTAIHIVLNEELEIIINGIESLKDELK